jgi:hypothetical protein
MLMSVALDMNSDVEIVQPSQDEVKGHMESNISLEVDQCRPK